MEYTAFNVCILHVQSVTTVTATKGRRFIAKPARSTHLTSAGAKNTPCVPAAASHCAKAPTCQCDLNQTEAVVLKPPALPCTAVSLLVQHSLSRDAISCWCVNPLILSTFKAELVVLL